MAEAILPFTVEEFRQRLDKVQKGMEAAGVEVLLVTAPENIYYLTGYHTVGYFSFQMLILCLDRDPIMLARGINAEMARHQSWLSDVESYGDTDSPNDALVRVLESHGLAKKRIGNQNDAFFFSVSQYKRLVAALGRDPLDGSGIIERVRWVKSPAELAYMREAGRCCAASLDAAIDACRAGATENDVAAALHQALIAAGSEYLGHAPLVCAGPGGGWGMDTWHRRPIGEDDVVFLECGGTYERYNVGLSRSVLVGNPGDKWRRMFDACREGYLRARDTVKAGVTSHEVDKPCRDHIVAQGFPFEKRVGYGIGIGFPPDWGEGRTQSINRGDDMVLETGMVFHLIPGIRITGEGAVFFSETLTVTDTGCEVLTPYSHELAIK